MPRFYCQEKNSCRAGLGTDFKELL